MNLSSLRYRSWNGSYGSRRRDSSRRAFTGATLWTCCALAVLLVFSGCPRHQSATDPAKGSSKEITKPQRSAHLSSERLSITPASITLPVGESFTFSATSTWNTDSFTWTTSDPTALSVTGDGTVTVLKSVSTPVTVEIRSARTGATGSAQVLIGAVTISGASTIPVGGTARLTAVSSDAQDVISWDANYESVATVDSTGLVTAIAAGAVTITATGSHSGARGERILTVLPALSSRVIWDGELSFSGSYGLWNHADQFKGSGCFEGTPTQDYAPVIRLQNLPSWRSDLSSFDEIWFFAKSDQAGSPCSLRMSGTYATTGEVDIAPYIAGGALDTTYRLVRIPIAVLKNSPFDLNGVESLYFGQSAGGASYHIFIDDVWAVNLDGIDSTQMPIVGQLPLVEFGDLPAGSSSHVIVPITNMGSATLHVTSIAVTGANSNLFSVPYSSFDVAPGASHDFDVTFAPTHSGSMTATCTFQHNMTALGASSTLLLSGTGVAPAIELSKSTLQFGDVPVGLNCTHTVSIENIGNATLDISQISSSNSAFVVSPTVATLDAGTTGLLTINFVPDAPGDYAATLTLQSNDPATPSRQILVSGKGIATGQEGALPLELDSVSSASISVSWGAFATVDSLKVYIAPEPSTQPGGALPGQVLWTTLPGTAVACDLDGIAAADDIFIRVEAFSGATRIASGNTHARTVGGPRAKLDTPLRAVHAVAPNILLFVVADEWVQSYSGSTGSLVDYTGPEWQDASQWSLAREDGSPITVSTVYRHSIPMGHPHFIELGVPNYANVDHAYSIENKIIAVDHQLYLVLNQPLGAHGVLTVTGPRGLTFTMPFSDNYLETPAIKVNQVGYSPAGNRRYAYVSGWMGDGGGLPLASYPANATVVIDPANPMQPRATALNNLPIALRAANDTNAGCEVREIDLSALPPAEGTVYRVRIPGVGVSWPTQVSYTAMFKAYYTVARGMYFNRFGRELRADTTEFGPRPPDHPVVYTAEKTEWGYGSEGEPHFDPATPLVGARALRGGHHDAGDWDIQMAHYIMPVVLMRAYQMNPAAFTDGQLTIPESGNGIPDILDEVLYNLAGWEQLQEDDGGVRAGVESFGHAPACYYADDDSMPYWTYARAPLHTARVAGLFAWASRLVQACDADKSAELAERATRAYNYAMANGLDVQSLGTIALASSELNRIFPDPAYVAQYESTMDYFSDYPTHSVPLSFRALDTGEIFAEQTSSLSVCIVNDYLLADNVDTTKWYYPVTVNRMTALADLAVDAVENNNPHRNGRPVGYPIGWGQGTCVGDYVMPIVNRLELGGLTPEQEQTYRDTLSLSADYVLGCNESGMVWITGLGSRYPMDPLHTDAQTFYFDGFGLMPGITVFGPTTGVPNVYYYDYGKHVFYPDFLDQPLMRRYADLSSFVSNNEGEFLLNAVDTQLFGLLLPDGMTPPQSWLPWGTEHRNTLAPREDATP